MALEDEVYLNAKVLYRNRTWTVSGLGAPKTGKIELENADASRYIWVPTLDVKLL